MQSQALSVDAYLAELPADRRHAVQAVRSVILANLDAEIEEGMQYGVIGYFVPHRVFPAGYHADPKQPLPFAALASQKHHLSLYLMGLYCGCGEGPGAPETPDARWFRQAWAASGKKLEMGKACVRFKHLDDVPLDVIGQAIKRVTAQAFIARYVEARAAAKLRVAQAPK